MMHSANNSIVINEKTHKKDANASLGYQNLVHVNFFFTNRADPKVNETLFQWLSY